MLKVAPSANAAGSSQLPGRWEFDVRARRGDPSARALICPCTTKLRSILAVERHLARSDGECVTRFASSADGGYDLCAVAAAAPNKLSSWMHKYDGGLIPSD
mmetsp:Transcript_16687/g.41760  ORF Transcript_16687/g.41760 Transcript_16687/m.41760 type:complete len:102 (+) Transcript_16687:3-308(+)